MSPSLAPKTLSTSDTWTHLEILWFLGDKEQVLVVKRESLCNHWWTLLGALAKLRSATISFFMSVHLSLSPHRTSRLPLEGYLLNLIFEYFFWKSVKNNSNFIKSDRNNGYFPWRPIYIFDHISLISFRMRNISGKLCRDNPNTHFTFNNLYRKSCRLWDTVGKFLTAGQATDDSMAACALCAG